MDVYNSKALKTI